MSKLGLACSDVHCTSNNLALGSACFCFFFTYHVGNFFAWDSGYCLLILKLNATTLHICVYGTFL